MAQPPPKPPKNSKETHAGSHDHAKEKADHTAHRHSDDDVSTKIWGLIDRTILMRVAGLCLAGVIGVGGGLALKSYIANMREGDVYGLEGKVQKLCENKVKDLDCECLWESAGDAFTLDNASDILDILADRRRWSGQITRARIKKVSNEKSAGLVSQALYQCTLLF